MFFTLFNPKRSSFHFRFVFWTESSKRAHIQSISSRLTLLSLSFFLSCNLSLVCVCAGPFHIQSHHDAFYFCLVFCITFELYRIIMLIEMRFYSLFLFSFFAIYAKTSFSLSSLLFWCRAIEMHVFLNFHQYIYYVLDECDVCVPFYIYVFCEKRIGTKTLFDKYQAWLFGEGVHYKYTLDKYTPHFHYSLTMPT